MQWFIDNKLIEGLFRLPFDGEVFKLSEDILKYVSHKITPEHIDVIWRLTRTEQYEERIFEILSNLFGNFPLQTLFYLYSLLWKAKFYSDDVLDLASKIICHIWSENSIKCDIVLNDREKPVVNGLYSFCRGLLIVFDLLL